MTTTAPRPTPGGAPATTGEPPLPVPERVPAQPLPAPVGGRLRLVPYALWAAFTGLYALMSLTRYDRLVPSSWDLAIFSQAARSYAERGYPVVDVKGPGFALLGDHFSPAVAAWAPLWAAVPSPATLLVAQAVLVGFSVVPLARVGMRLLGPAAGCAVAVAYGLSFGVQGAVDFDVHEYAFAAPLLTLAGEAYLLRRWRATCLWAGCLVLVKEDLGLTVVAVGAVLVLAGARRWGAGLAVLGTAVLALTLLVLIPVASADGTWDYWTRLGGDGSASGVWAGLAGLPGQLVSNGTKVQTWLLTFGVTGFLALRSPWVLVALPTLLWRLGSDYTFYWGTDLHYSLVPAAVLFVALVDAVWRARFGRREWLRRYAAYGPAVALAVALALCLHQPVADLFSARAYADTARERQAERVLASVPAGTSVETDIGLLAALVPGHEVYFTGTNDGPGSVAPDWVVVDTSIQWDPATSVAAWAEQRHPGADYEPEPPVGRYLLARRVP